VGKEDDFWVVGKRRKGAFQWYIIYMDKHVNLRR
jgi:hypothetical protein